MEKIYAVCIYDEVKHCFKTKSEAVNWVFDKLIADIENFGVYFTTEQKIVMWEAIKNYDKPIIDGNKIEYQIYELDIESYRNAKCL